MAIVFFRAGGSPWRQATVPVTEYTRICSAEREFGAAKLFIPRNHEILSTDSISEDGGTFVRIEHALLPTWYGIQEGLMDQNVDGWTFEATEIGILLKYNTVPPFAMGASFPAGQIVHRAFESLTDQQRGGIRAGSFVESTPLVHDYEHAGGPLTTILTDLSDQTEQEWEIAPGSDGSLILNWIAPRGALYEPLLVESHDLINVHRIPDTTALVRLVRATNRDNGTTGEASAPELIDDWLAQTVTIESDETSFLGLERVAQRYLEQHRYRSVRYRFGVRGHWTRSTVDVTVPGNGGGGGGSDLYGEGVYGEGLYGEGGGGGEEGPVSSTTTIQIFSAPAWTIRPGDYLRAVLPSAGKGGTTILARVMRMSFGDGYAEPVFECQEIRPVDPAQLAMPAYRGQRQTPQPTTVPRMLVRLGA